MSWYPCPFCGMSPGKWERLRELDLPEIFDEKVRGFHVTVERCLNEGCGHVETRYIEKGSDSDGSKSE